LNCKLSGARIHAAKEEEVKQKVSWFIRNAKYISTSFLLKSFILFGVIQYVVLLVLFVPYDFIGTELFEYVLAAVAVIYVVLLIVMVFMIRKSVDAFYLKREFLGKEIISSSLTIYTSLTANCSHYFTYL
jgi:hypothetical protein